MRCTEYRLLSLEVHTAKGHLLLILVSFFESFFTSRGGGDDTMLAELFTLEVFTLEVSFTSLFLFSPCLLLVEVEVESVKLLTLGSKLSLVTVGV